jgi:hypothetical protein
MAALVWGAWSPDWALGNKVDFDGINRIIYVHPEVTALDIRSEVYSAWIDWVVLRDNAKYLPAMRYTGFDPIGGGQYTGDSYFLINGWKLSVDLAKVRVTGVLFSDNYDTAYYTPSLVAQYPATVSALVSTVSVAATVSANDIWSHSTRALSVNPPTASEVADATWAHSFANKLLTVAKFLGLK